MFNKDSLNSGGGFAIHPEGVVAAVCVAVLDLGTQTVESQKYGTKLQRKVAIQFQTSKIIEDEGDFKGQPYLAQSRFTLTTSDKGLLRPFIESWRGKKYSNDDEALVGLMNMNKMLGFPAQLNIMHSPDGKYANISAIMPLMNKADAPQATKTPLFFSLDIPDWDVYKQLSEGMQKVIAQSPEYKNLTKGDHHRGPDGNAPPDDDWEQSGPDGAADAGNSQDFDDDIPF